MAAHYEYPISAVPHKTPLAPQGPLVLPGTYTVRLTIDGKTETALFTVKMDPRVRTAAADLEAKHEAQTKMAVVLDDLAKADLEAHSVLEQVSAGTNASMTEQFAPFVKQLNELLEGSKEKGREEQAGLDDLSGEAATLYGLFDQSDEPMTQAMTKTASHVQEEGKEAQERWRAFVAKQVPSINQMLRQGSHPELNLQKAPENMPAGGDED
jgi:hypothetical protein